MKSPPVLYASCVLAPVVMLHIQMDLAAPCIMQSEDSFRLNWTSPWSTIFDSCLASPRLPRPPRPPLYQRACMPADLSATRRSLSSHRLAALLWSWACADGRQRKQLLKYMPPTPSSSGATAQYTVVAAPCCCGQRSTRKEMRVQRATRETTRQHRPAGGDGIQRARSLSPVQTGAENERRTPTAPRRPLWEADIDTRAEREINSEEQKHPPALPSPCSPWWLGHITMGTA